MPGQIVTVTLNPAVDLSSNTAVVAPHHKLRCTTPSFDAGGGGINVSRVCSRLGAETVAVAPLGGRFGLQLASLLEDENIKIRQVPIKADTRLSVTITEDERGDNYRFVFPGPSLDDDEIDALLDAVEAEAKASAAVVLSGSFPPGRSGELLDAIVERLPDTRLIIDTSGPALDAAFRTPAYLIKPSARELAAMVGRELRTEADIAQAADEVVSSSPVESLLVSIGAGGAVLRSDHGSARLRAPTVQVRSTVGAGDSMVAGIVVGLSRGMDLVDAVSLGVAAGTATCLSGGTSLCEPADIDQLLPLVTVD